MEDSVTYRFENGSDAVCARGLFFDGWGASSLGRWIQSPLPAPFVDFRAAWRSILLGDSYDREYREALLDYARARNRWDQLASAPSDADAEALDYQANLPARYENLRVLRERVCDLVTTQLELSED